MLVAMYVSADTESNKVCELHIHVFDKSIIPRTNMPHEKRCTTKCCLLKWSHFLDWYEIYYLAWKNSLQGNESGSLATQKMVWWFSTIRCAHLQSFFGIFFCSEEMITLIFPWLLVFYKINDYAFSFACLLVFKGIKKKNHESYFEKSSELNVHCFSQ